MRPPLYSPFTNRGFKMVDQTSDNMVQEVTGHMGLVISTIEGQILK